MKKALLLFVVSGISLTFQAQVVLNEVIFGGSPAVELKNIGSTEVNTSSYFLCSFPTYTQIQNATVLSGSVIMSPGSILVVTGHAFNTLDDELGLYSTSGFSTPANMLDYVEWGSTGHQRSSVAVSAGIWSTGDFVTLGAGTGSIEYDGSGDSSADWLYATGNTQGQENSNVPGCEASAFMLGNATRCEGQTATFNIVLTGEAPWTVVYSLNGTNQDPIITSQSIFPLVVGVDGTYQLNSVSDALCVGEAIGSAELTIMPLPSATLFGDGFVCGTGPGELEVVFTGTGPWTWEYHLDGIPQGEEVVEMSPYFISASLPGEYNPVTVSDQFCTGTVSGSVAVTFHQVESGDLSFEGIPQDTLTLCVDDDESDLIGFVQQNIEGEETALLITDELDQIVQILSGLTYDFEGGSSGTNQVWSIAYTLGIEGLTLGSEVPDQLIGCFSLSEPLTVISQTGTVCVTSVNEPFQASAFALFPNPAEEVLNVQFNMDVHERLFMSIIDIQGRSLTKLDVFLSSISQFTIDTSTLSQGLYLLRIQSESGEQIELPFVK